MYHRNVFSQCRAGETLPLVPLPAIVSRSKLSNHRHKSHRNCHRLFCGLSTAEHLRLSPNLRILGRRSTKDCSLRRQRDYLYDPQYRKHHYGRRHTPASAEDCHSTSDGSKTEGFCHSLVRHWNFVRAFISFIYLYLIPSKYHSGPNCS